MGKRAPARRRLPVRGIELFAAAWMTVSFALRVGYELYLFHPAFRGRWLQSLLAPATLLMLVLGFPLLLLGVALEREGLTRMQKWLGMQLQRLKKRLKNWRTYAFSVAVLLVAELIRGALQGASLYPVAKRVLGGIWSKAQDYGMVLLLALGLYLIWWVVRLLLMSHRFGPREVVDQVYVWYGAGFFIVTLEVLALLVYALCVDRVVQAGYSPGARIALWSGFLKDTIIYAVIALFVASGLLKFERCVPILKGRSPWYALASMGFAALIAAVGALYADVRFAGEVLQGGGHVSGAIREAWQMRAAHLFIYVRDFALLVPGIVIIFAWLTLRIASIQHEQTLARRRGSGRRRKAKVGDGPPSEGRQAGDGAGSVPPTGA